MPTLSTPNHDSTGSVREAYDRAIEHLRTRQHDNGAFAGEVIWNPMLVCQFVILRHVVGHPIVPERRARIYLSLQRQVRPDGGWGMHPDSHSYLFHTTLGYVALRLLGYAPQDPLVGPAARWIAAHGGPRSLPTWGRIWLALLGLYPWTSVQPILPELWLLPERSALHPRRLYCHMRLIYLGLSYVYGARLVAASSPIVESIRRELYPEGYDPHSFPPFGREIAETDLFEAPSAGLLAAFTAMGWLERASPSRLRERALEVALEHIIFEFRSTGYVCLSPVNGFLFCLALFAADPHHPELGKALGGMEYWAWEDDALGLRFCGARSDIWDTSFVIAALCEAPQHPHAAETVARAARWLATAQLQEEIVGGPRHYRELAYGGWGFANEYHPWPVSDCTAEALEALLRAEGSQLSDASGRLQSGRALAAVEFILRRQNDDGGFGSYEARRGSMVLRRFNPAEIYGNCMLEYSYIECTGSCVRALAFASRTLGDAMPTELGQRARRAIERGTEFLLANRYEPGGWLGFWGINITYGTFFATSGLLAAGVSRSHPHIAKSVRWLLAHQRPDGGWGEHSDGVLHSRAAFVPADEPSLVVQTAWALLTLLDVAPHEKEAIDRGIAFLIERQQTDGQWPRERASGVFFNTAVLDYDLYRQTFPTWALARYQRVIAPGPSQRF